MTRFFRIYLVPGFIFQSLIIGGGYGTGREIVEFFLNEGPLGGLLAIALTTVIWCFVMAITFEWARLNRTWEYKSFIDRLLGKAWIGYELFYVISLVLIISVLGSASGEITHNMLDISPFYGILIMMAGVGLLAYFGSKLIERVLSFWSIALYLVYGILVIMALVQFSGEISHSFNQTGSNSWFSAGVRYSAYNIGLLPAVLFVARRFENRREAIFSGIAGGMLAIIPGLLIYFALLSQYPQILEKAIPTEYLLEQMNFPLLTLAFQLILLGTFIETGVGLIHGFNERISEALRKRHRVLTNRHRLVLAVVILITAIFLADSIGIVDLIAQGYTFLAWLALLVFVIPMLTIGLFRIMKGR